MKLPKWVQPDPHVYSGYAGPWIENYFHGFWNSSQEVRSRVHCSGFEYLPIYWTDLYVRWQRPLYVASRLSELLNSVIDPNKRYFTIVQHDLGVQIEVPDNVLVFGAGGVGDIPIPLLMRPMSRRVQDKTKNLGFAGKITGPNDQFGVRREMRKHCERISGYQEFELSNFNAYCENISSCQFFLCPRGFGATSFRFYETISLGSIPIYIWRDVCWLPYKEELDWSKIAIVFEANELSQLQSKLDSISEHDIRSMSQYTSEIYDSYFTYAGICRWIVGKIGSL